MVCSAVSKVSMRPAVRPARASRVARVSPRAALDTAFVISGSTAALLAVGRFVFLPYQRRELEWSDAVGPKTTGTSYFDDLQKTPAFFASSKDPSGFNIIDVLAWGALGHAVGFAVLGVASNF